MAHKSGRKRAPDVGDLRDGRLSYGTPVSVDGRTVIPVTRVRVERGEGKSRTIDSSPLGFIEVTADGSSFHPIAAPGRRPALPVAAAAALLGGAVAGARALRRARRPQRLLPAGRPRLHR